MTDIDKAPTAEDFWNRVEDTAFNLTDDLGMIKSVLQENFIEFYNSHRQDFAKDRSNTKAKLLEDLYKQLFGEEFPENEALLEYAHNPKL